MGLETPEVVGVHVRRIRFVYPVYAIGYERHFETLDRWASRLPDLVSFGRQGLFAHDNTHHALAMAYAAVTCLGDDGFDRTRWEGYRKEFETHVVED
jgi:protoporphyrinogen oxidase